MVIDKWLNFYFRESKNVFFRILIHFLFWTLVCLFNWIINYGSFPYTSGSEKYYYLLNCSVVICFTYLFPCLFSNTRSWLLLLLAVFLSVVFFMYFNYYSITLLNQYSPNERGFMSRYKGLLGDINFSDIWKHRGLFGVTFNTTIYLFYLPMVIKLSYEVIKKLYFERRLKEENMQLELDFLRAQVNPHFLFNTVNNIYSMVLDNERAANSLLRLADLMRYTLYEAGNESVPLKRELEFINEYIDLERLRLPHHKTIHLEIKGDIKTQVIKPLILITFVENAIKHGINKTNGSAHADIKIEIKNNDLVLHCSNSVVADIKPEGLGLSNTLKRLSYYYPDRHQYTQTTENGNYTVVLHIAL